MSTRRKVIYGAVLLTVSILLAWGNSDATQERSDEFRNVMNTILVLVLVGGVIYLAVSLAIRHNRRE